MREMESRIYTGKVMHARGWPLRHAFHYPVYFYGIDVDELDDLDRAIPLFGHNRVRLVSIHDKDFLLPGNATMRQRVENSLEAHGVDQSPTRIVLITSARFLNYVFNPVTFFYCYAADDSLLSIIAFVNNTFGESHLYLLREPLDPMKGFDAHYRAEKQFHVSPFFDLNGYYDFHFSKPVDTLDALIKLHKNGQHVFTARLTGRGRELTTRNLVRTILRYPLTAALTFPRITWQAARLYYQRKLPVFHKPIPESPDTVRFAPPSRLQKWAMAAVLRAFGRLHRGRLIIVLPDRRSLTFGESAAENEITVQVKRYDFFWRIAAGGDTGLGEAYMAGDWNCEQVAGFLRLLAWNWDVLQQRPRLASASARLLDYLAHMRRANTVIGSRRNIHRHYDLSNDFFQLFLDPSMTYSCGRYDSADDSLAQAQKNKLHSIIRKADIRAEHHVLEVGCGWGSFAIEAARETGCRVTGITVSDEQYELATKQVKDEGLEDRVTIEKRDYRHLEQTYDRIVSIEMLEAVGHAYLETFFRAMREALKADGRLVIQVITIPDQRYEQYRKSSDWIKKYIFPGGHLPSLTALCSAATRASDLVIEHVENIGEHYAPTLHQWCENLLTRAGDARKLGFDDVFLRKWEYYFCYCEAGFGTRMLNDLQLVMRPTGP